MTHKQTRTTRGQISSMIEQTSTLSTIKVLLNDLSIISFTKRSLKSLNSFPFK